MSMVSYAAGSRYLSLIGGVCMSFYDWYCDLPPASPQVWGEQTDVPESADWYNSTFLIAWGSNVPQTRTPDAHFFTEVRYKGAKTVAVTPDYSEVAKLADIWLHPQQGTDAALAMAMGHVALKEFYFEQRHPYFDDYARRYTDLPLLVMLEEHTLSDGRRVMKPGRYLRASDFENALGQENNPEWKRWPSIPVAGWSPRRARRLAGADGRTIAAPGISRPGLVSGDEVTLKSAWSRRRAGSSPSVLRGDGGAAFPGQRSGRECARAGGAPAGSRHFTRGRGRDRVRSQAPVRHRPRLRSGAASYDDDAPYTPAWQEHHRRAACAGHHGGPPVRDNAARTRVYDHHRRGNESRVPRHELPRRHQPADAVRLCRAERRGWVTTYQRAAPATGWLLGLALDWQRPPASNSTSFHAHTDQSREA